MVEVLPFLINCFLGFPWEGDGLGDGDTSEVFGFDGLECRNNPLDGWPCPHKLQTFEFCGLGEVKQRVRYICVRE